MNLVDAIARVARAAPDRRAVIEAPSGRTLTFGELDVRVDALAAALCGRLAPGDRVAVLARNCPEYLEVYLACARAGCVAHGMNWRLATPAMLEHLRDSAPRLVVVQDAFADVALELQRDLDAEWVGFGPGSDGSYEDMLASTPAVGPRRSVDGDAPLAIMYTGGTTGDSRGALHSHATMLAAMANNTIAERIVPTDRYLLLGQAFHSAAVLALNYLRHGCAVVVIDFDPDVALSAVEEHGATAFLGFPAMLTHMLEKGGGGGYRLDSLRNIQYGGGSFPQSVVLAMLETFPCTLIQCYGTTESVGITFLSQEDHDRARHGHPELLRSCGLPAFLNEVRLAPGTDTLEDGRELGEVQVRSPANMLGYWRDRNNARAAGTRPEWLGTGDLGYLDDAGYLYIVGRSKDVIISGGENIYAGEVENVIYGHPSVLEAAVVGIADATWGEAVKAFVALRPGAEADAEEIRELVRRELGSYQKPKVVEFVDALPRAPTGKILKRALLEN